MSAAIPATFCARSADHVVVVVGVVRDVAGAVRLLEPADPVLEARACPGSPRRARASRGSRRYGRNSPSRFGSVANSAEMSGSDVDVREQPRLGAVREVGVGEQVDRRAVLERDPRRLDRGVEAAARRRGRDHRHRRLGVPPEQHHQQVGLLGLRRHPGRRAGALDVEDQSGSSSVTASPIVSAFSTTPGPLDVRDAERAAEGSRRAPRRRPRSRPRPGRCGRRSACAAARSSRMLGSRRDRVRAEEERQPALHARGDEPERERLVAGDVPVRAGRAASPASTSYETAKSSLVSP